MSNSTSTITPITPAAIATKATDPSFSLKCTRDDKTGEIICLAIDKLSLIEDGNVACEKQLDSSITVLKKDLEKLFQEENTFLDKNTFKVKSSNGNLHLHTKEQKLSQVTSIFKKIISILTSYTTNCTQQAYFERKTFTLPQSVSTKILDIQNRFNLNKIFTKTATHNIGQLNDRPKANSKITSMLLIALTVGILAGTIGIGAIFPHIGILISLGIPGISLPVSMSLMGLGALSIASYIGLRIAAKKSNIAKEYLNALHLKRSEWFLECNTNDLTNGALFILMAITFIHAPWLATVKGCLAYPTGILLIGSGAYQLLESFKDIMNNKKIGDKKETLKAAANFLCAAAIIAMGLLTTIGMINSPITIIVTMIVGALMASVNAYNLYKSLKQFKEISNIDKDNDLKIFEFLQMSLSIPADENKKLEEKIDKMVKEDIIEWILKNYKNWENEQKAIWDKIKKDLENSENIELGEIRKMILNEEVKNIIESKIERFGSIVNKKTLEEALIAIDDYHKDPKKNAENIKKLFLKIKSETKSKTIAETIKFLAINLPLMFIPFILPGINLKLYDYLMGAILFANLGINITPRYRNVPPTMLKKALDINLAIKTAAYHKYSVLTPSDIDPTALKANKAANATLTTPLAA